MPPVFPGTRTLRLNINRLQSDNGSFGVSVFGQDITALKKLESELRQSLKEVQQLRERLQEENLYLREEVKSLFMHSEIVGDSKPMQELLSQADQVSATDTTVLILGETGTGKELLAHAIHGMSRRKDRAMIVVNCASLPPTLIESELFGREKGAYTGSLTKMVGRFEIADGSTLFLDEIGELPLELQSKLLRVLEQGHFERLGSTRTIKVNVRLIAATNRDLTRDIADGKFRKDLYYRLNVFPLTVPPLRERKEDIPLIVWSFVKQFEKTLGKHVESIPRKNMEALINYYWPGNIRELRNVIEHAMILNSTGSLAVEPPTGASPEQSGSSVLQDIERKHILEVLEKTGWRISGTNGAAEILGMKRTTLQSKMKALSIKRSIL
ncbi:MAG: sigma 54-interacting transcriptional regulator [Deltaproteobacteria bacterium]|nr:sigma 54-interacting transcriptional regulator [Deltaproteobacteria bacterium]